MNFFCTEKCFSYSNRERRARILINDFMSRPLSFQPFLQNILKEKRNMTVSSATKKIQECGNFLKI